MGLVVFNSLTDKKEPFKPISAPDVGMYVCGVTVYNLSHIGHARAGVVFDVIYRYLEYSGYNVTYVRNITDIDDKIINRAREIGISADELAQKYTKEYHDDMRCLNLKSPTFEPKATDHIPEMLEMINMLIGKQHAYISDGSVYFSVKSFKDYGILSKKDIDDLLSGARVATNESKIDPLDFALWKKSVLADEPAWKTDWDVDGRPGWHIECSAMSRKLLGNKFDIHGGGKDLIFPHHENEIAQSASTTGDVPANYWIHNGFVTINEEKMSKSLGNFSLIRDIIKIHDPEALRLFLLGSHYRSPIDFADIYLVQSYKNLSRFYDLFLKSRLFGAIDEVKERNLSMIERFKTIMDDDFNTASALGFLNIELKRLNGVYSELVKSGRKVNDQLSINFITDVATMKELGSSVLGIFEHDPEGFVNKAKLERLKEIGMTIEQLDQLISERAAARKDKDFNKADKIRDLLKEKGIELQDGHQSVSWSISFE